VIDLQIREVTQIGKLIAEQNEYSFGEVEIIAIYLMHSKFCEPSINPFTKWLNILPQTFNSILYFEDEEVKYLLGTQLYGQLHAILSSSFDVPMIGEIFVCSFCRGGNYDEKTSRGIICSGFCPF
jgi:hypothetical protein